MNRYEKEVIMYLSSVESANADTIYKNTCVPKGRVYSVLKSLIHEQIVNVIPTSPKNYTIDDVKERLYSYIERKRTLLEQTKQELTSLSLEEKNWSPPVGTPTVYTFSGRDEQLNALVTLRTRVKKSMIQIAPIFDGTYSSNLSLYKALERGVQFQVIVRKVTKGNQKNIAECVRLGAKVKTLDSDDLIYFLLCDKKECILGLEDFTKKEERLCVYLKQQSLLRVLEEYFAKVWKKAKTASLHEFPQSF